MHMYRKRETNPRARRELPMTEMSLAAASKNIQETDLYDAINEERVGYEPLGGGRPRVPPAYEVLGPEYIRVIG